MKKDSVNSFEETEELNLDKAPLLYWKNPKT